MIKDCFKGGAELKAYLIAYHGLLYYEEECFFGDGAVYGYCNHQYIEAYCVEEAKNLYRALTLQQEYVDSDECPINNIDCLGIYSERECGEPQFSYLAFEDRPIEYQRRVHHVGDRVQDLFAITDKQWEAIEHLSEVTKSKFLGITKREASEFISKKVEEVSEWKKAHSRRKSYQRTHSRPRYNPDDQADWENDCAISWLDLCGDM